MLNLCRSVEASLSGGIWFLSGLLSRFLDGFFGRRANLVRNFGDNVAVWPAVALYPFWEASQVRDLDSYSATASRNQSSLPHAEYKTARQLNSACPLNIHTVGCCFAVFNSEVQGAIQTGACKFVV